MIKLNVQLFGILADHLPREDKGKASVELADSSRFRDLTEKLGIRRKVTFAVNGEIDQDVSAIEAEVRPMRDFVSFGDRLANDARDADVLHDDRVHPGLSDPSNETFRLS